MKPWKNDIRELPVLMRMLFTSVLVLSMVMMYSFPVHASVGDDSDGDGLTDDEEIYWGTDPYNWDTDGDGLPDGAEVNSYGTDPTRYDTDWDGLSDGDEYGIYFTDPTRYDTDGDGLDDYEEVIIYGTDPHEWDTDNDDLYDYDEIVSYLTDPNDYDTDSDGLSDGREIFSYSTNPNDPDSDSDGLTDYEEVMMFNTDPNDFDTDSDGLDDYDEVMIFHTDPEAWDTDYDGLYDYEEVMIFNTDPTNYDTDYDGLSDGEEVNIFGTDPLDQDSDNDTLPDGYEVDNGTDPNMYDTDGDGLSDGEEYGVYFTDPLDIDSDDDGLTDGEEVNVYGTPPNDADWDGDSFNDYEEVMAGSDPYDAMSIPQVPPVAMDDLMITSEDAPINIDALANDYDMNSDPIAIYSLDTTVTLGDASVVGDVVYYDPREAFNHLQNGTSTDDYIYYTIYDGYYYADALITVTVSGVNDAPVLDPINDQSVVWGTSITTINPVVTDPDVGDTTLFSLTGALPDGLSFSSVTGEISGAPDKEAIGVYPLILKVTDSQDDFDSENFTITVEKRTPVLELTSTIFSAQYSDMATLSATLFDEVEDPDEPLEGEYIEFALGTQSDSDDTDADGEAEVTITLDQPASYADLIVSFAGNDYYNDTEILMLDGFEIVKEDAEVSFTDTQTSIKVESDGGNSPAFILTVEISEMLPDLPIESSAAGDISKILVDNVQMTLTPVGPGTPMVAIGALDYNGETGYAGNITASFSFDDVPVNTYEVTLSLTNSFYRLVDNVTVFTVYDPSLGFTTGGGTFYWPGTQEKTNFGYVMQYNKKATNVKGSVLIIKHTDEGTYRIKSNALDTGGLAIGSIDDYGWASFSGKCTYAEPDWSEPVGNVRFVVYVEDRNDPGTGTDRIWLEVDYEGTSLSMNKPSVDNAVDIDGGNIYVPHKTARVKK